MVEAYEAGATTTQLRQQFSVSQDTVVRLLRRHGVVTRHKGLSDSDLQQARELYESGLPVAKVGEKLGRAPSTVRRALVQAGVEMRPRGGWHGRSA
jgi:predicted transcriptional regulator